MMRGGDLASKASAPTGRGPAGRPLTSQVPPEGSGVLAGTDGPVSSVTVSCEAPRSLLNTGEKIFQQFCKYRFFHWP